LELGLCICQLPCQLSGLLSAGTAQVHETLNLAIELLNLLVVLVFVALRDYL
jgi:hypothetical protein